MAALGKIDGYIGEFLDVIESHKIYIMKIGWLWSLPIMVEMRKDIMEM